MEGPDATRRIDDAAAQIVYAILAAAGGKPSSDWRDLRVNYSENWYKRESAKKTAKTANVDTLKKQAAVVMENAKKVASRKR